MVKITSEQVKQVADVAMLSITDEEAAMFEAPLSQTIAYADMLNDVDTTAVKPTTHVDTRTNVMRKDVVENKLTQEEALNNAPRKQDGQFKVPSILE